MKNKKRMKQKACGFFFDTPYVAIRVLAIWDYIWLLSDGLLKDGPSEAVAKTNVKMIKNRRIRWFPLQILTCGDYFIEYKALLISSQGKHKKVTTYLDDEDIRLKILV